MKVALYARVSTEQQIENYSIPLQKERIKAFCTSKGWNEVKEYIDAGYSGAHLNRPALEQLQKDIKNKKANMTPSFSLKNSFYQTTSNLSHFQKPLIRAPHLVVQPLGFYPSSLN